MSHSKNRGIAIISTLLFVGLLFMMALSVIMMSRQRAFVGVAQHQHTQALYLAEAGLARSMVALESDLDWPGITDGQIDGIAGSYTVRFDTDKYGSVNNISKPASARSYRGDGTVPPNTAMLVVDSQVAGHRYVLEAMVRGTGGTGYITDAVLADGKVRAKGDLQVDGIAALDDSAAVDGSIQSNISGSNDLVVWEGGGTALVTGNVGSSGDAAGAIDMPGATILGGSELSSSAHIPDEDIVGEVNSNLGHPAPVFVPGGTTTLSGSHTYTPSSPNSLSGDIVLENDATLYVNGDLSIVGSISGSGTVYVNGKTSFKGDSSITTNPDFSVALYSEGSVSLTGFDGTEFLENLNDPEITEYLAVSEVALREVQEAANAPGAGPSGATRTRIWNFSAAMGLHLNDDNTPGAGPPVTHHILGEERSNILGKLKAKVEALPNGPTQDFLTHRVDELNKVFGSRDDLGNYSGNNAALSDFDATGETLGYVDAVLLDQSPARWPQVVNLVNSVSVDKLGSSYFQGAIYTKGHFYSNNEVSILGALIVKAKGGTPENVTLPNGTIIPLSSGDVYLGNRSRVTYVEEMFKDDDSSDPTGPQMLARTVWIGR